MTRAFETLGNATIQLFEDGAPIFVTDPWLHGTCYYGSWAHERPPSDSQIEAARCSPYVWISHGHPDHLHADSLSLLDRKNQTILVPAHYRPEMQEFLADEGFQVEVMAYREWKSLGPSLSVCSLPNPNQDAILLMRFGPDLLINLNDSPVAGEEPFLRRRIKEARRTWVFALCSNDADMLNIVDHDDVLLAGDPEEKKPGTVLAAADLCSRLGAQHFCCSSSQHIYARRDSAWANPYRITYADMERYWVSKAKLWPPYIRADLESETATSGEGTSNEPAPPENLEFGGDNWATAVSPSEWSEITAFFLRHELLSDHLDWIDFTLGDERRRIAFRESIGDPPRGIHFRVPAESLLAAIRSGYFDELLIGNFMRTELTNVTLYPDFTPIVAKLGGNAKVFTKADERAFRRHYFRLSPGAYLREARCDWWVTRGVRSARRAARAVGLFHTMKRWFRNLSGLPPLPENWPPPVAPKNDGAYPDPANEVD